MSFLNLPPEILIEILRYLDVLSTFACIATCRLLDETIGSSTLLRYTTQLAIAGMHDNPSTECHIPLADRLMMLKEREAAWRTLNWRFVTTVDVPERWSGVYDVSAGVCLLGKSGDEEEEETTRTVGVQTLKLPRHPSDESVEWTEFNFGMPLIDFGTSIEEHDLLACVSAVRDENDGDVSHIVVVLLRYSTKTMHDGCRTPVIPVSRAHAAQGPPQISIECVGENLALIVVFPDDPTEIHGGLHIFDWRSGRAKSDPLPVANTGLSFLREDLLLNPNTLLGCLDIYHIPSSALIFSPSTSTSPSFSTPNTPRLIHSLLLPTPSSAYRIASFGCRAEPNPTGRGHTGSGDDPVFPTYTRPTRPFANDPREAIMVLTMELVPSNSDTRNRRSRTKRFVMIVHRRAILDALPSLQNERVDLNLNLHANLNPTPVVAKSYRIGSQTQTQTQTPYASWGPPVCRWFFAADFGAPFVTTTAGQRCVVMTPAAGTGVLGPGAHDNASGMRDGGTYGGGAVISDDEDEDEDEMAPVPDTIRVLDFNPWHVKLARHVSRLFDLGGVFGLVGGSGPLGGSGGSGTSGAYASSGSQASGSETTTAKGPKSASALASKPTPESPEDTCPTHGAFAQPFIVGRLPYLVCTADGRWEYDGVVMDEERVLGVRNETEEQNASVDVIYFG